jgi:hypothetical protein
MKPNDTSTLTGTENQEGLIREASSLSLDLTEDQLLQVINTRVEDSVAWWEKEQTIKKIREDNEKRWLNRNYEVDSKSQLYDFEAPYKDNRIFVSIETLVSSLVGQLPEPILTEGQDTDASRELAGNYGKVLKRKSEDWGLKAKFQMVARHLLIGYRVGVMKYTWDFQSGGLKEDGDYYGDPSIVTLRPHKVVFEQEAEDRDNIPLVAEYMNATVEELGYKFSDKKDAIYALMAAETGNYRTLGKRTGYVEIWFTYLDSNGKKREGVCWKIKDLLMGSGLNPYFNYKTEAGKSNYFDAPKKPYVLFNFLSLGKYVIDDTSLTEQAANQQDILEKRGRQSVNNADQAESTKIFNTQMINAGDAENYVGDPKQSILVDGDVRAAFARVPPPLLPNYVTEEKFDARNEVDNIFGTHAPLRGERTKSPTLGQEVMSQRSDLGRNRTLSEELEVGAVKIFGGITQLYKVFATEEHFVKYSDQQTGRTSFVAFSADKIEDGMEIHIQAGSMMPDDKTVDKSDAIELAKLGGRVDPLTFFEKLHYQNPREAAKRLVYFLWTPDRYMNEILQIEQTTGQDQEAMAVLQRLTAGEAVPPKEGASKSYLATFEGFIKSPAFQQLDPEAHQLVVDHLRATLQLVKQSMGAPGNPQTPPAGPTPPAGGPPSPTGPASPAAPTPADAENPDLNRGGIMTKMLSMFRGAR